MTTVYFKMDDRDLIRQVDVHRPLGPNGKHGKLHTTTCGCEEKR